MKGERREIHTEDLVRPSAAADRAVLEREPVAGQETFSRPAEVERTGWRSSAIGRFSIDGCRIRSHGGTVVRK
jgi:hypothetical protein